MEYEYLFEDIQHSTAQKLYKCMPGKLPDYFVDVSLHWHNEFEINFMLEGSAIYQVGAQTYVSNAGDINIKAPGILHATHITENGHAYYQTLIFRPELFGFAEYERGNLKYLSRILSKKLIIKTPIRPTDAEYDRLARLIKEAMDAAKSDSSADDILLRSRLNEVFYVLIKNGYVIKNDLSVSHDADMEELNPALKYIADNFNHDIKIAKLASLTARSETSFMALFKRVLGVTAIEYITHLRINSACEMLRLTNRKIIDIAQSCGYFNLSNFNRIFKRKTGSTPREYRNQFNQEFENGIDAE